jgi:hypothetical protein
MLLENGGHNLRALIPYLPVEEIPLESSGGSGAINRAHLIPIWVPGIFTCSNILVSITVSSGNLDLGIYDKNGNRVASTGSTASPGTGQRKFALSATLKPSLNPYYLALAVNNTTIAFNFTNHGTPGSHANEWPESFYFASSFPLPATLNLAAPSGTFNYIGLFLENVNGPVF